MYKPRNGKLGMGPIWDFDRSMDSSDSRDDSPTTWHGTSDATDYFNYIWWDHLFKDANFYQKYIDRWYALRKGPFSTANINATINGMANEVREAQVRNQQKWPSVGPRPAPASMAPSRARSTTSSSGSRRAARGSIASS